MAKEVNKKTTLKRVGGSEKMISIFGLGNRKKVGIYLSSVIR